jgi:hypothetical protein
VRPEDIARDDAALAQKIDTTTSKIAQIVRDIKEIA